MSQPVVVLDALKIKQINSSISLSRQWHYKMGCMTDVGVTFRAEDLSNNFFFFAVGLKIRGHKKVQRALICHLKMHEHVFLDLCFLLKCTLHTNFSPRRCMMASHDYFIVSQ